MYLLMAFVIRLVLMYVSTGVAPPASLATLPQRTSLFFRCKCWCLGMDFRHLLQTTAMQRTPRSSSWCEELLTLRDGLGLYGGRRAPRGGLKHVRVLLLLARFALRHKTLCKKGLVHVTLHCGVCNAISLQHKHMCMYGHRYIHLLRREASHVALRLYRPYGVYLCLRPSSACRVVDRHSLVHFFCAGRREL